LSCSARVLFYWEKPPSAWQCPITVAALAARSSLQRFFQHRLGNLFGWDLVWKIILIAAGISLILGNYLRRL